MSAILLALAMQAAAAPAPPASAPQSRAATPRTPLPAAVRETLPTADRPAPEAIALGAELAASGFLASLAPALIDKDVAELAAEDKTLTPAERAELTALGRAEGKAAFARLAEAMGLAYARRLSLADLQALVAFNRTPAADRWRAAQAPVMMEAMAGAGAIDLKKSIAAAFCARRAKLCKRD